jgi:methanogenic corrinoid protein MtbC1
VVQDVVQVTLAEMGERWSRGEVGVGEEHFATNLLRGRLLGLARGWGLGTGPLAVLACPPDEMHELGLVCFGLILRSRGWRVALLGSDTPINAVGETATHTAADLVVLSAVDGARFDQAGAEIRALADRWPVVLGGAGADAHHEELGARVLPGGPVDAALFVSGEAAGWR